MRIFHSYGLFGVSTFLAVINLTGCAASCLDRLAGSIIVMIAYGYKSKGDDDIIIKTVDKAMEEFAIVMSPGAFLADVFPIRRCKFLRSLEYDA